MRIRKQLLMLCGIVLCMLSGGRTHAMEAQDFTVLDENCEAAMQDSGEETFIIAKDSSSMNDNDTIEDDLEISEIEIVEDLQKISAMNEESQETQIIDSGICDWKIHNRTYYELMSDGTMNIAPYEGNDGDIQDGFFAVDFLPDGGSNGDGSDAKYLNIKGVKSIGSAAFDNNTSILTLSMDRALERIGSYAFSGCTKLHTIEMPDSVRSIGSGAFSWCTSIDTLYIPENVETIGNGITRNSNVRQFSVSEENPYFTVSENMLFNKDKTKFLQPIGSPERIVVPDGIQIIAEAAFYSFRDLETVVLPESVTKIEKEAFKSCSELKEVLIPASVQEIAEDVFKDCPVLTIKGYPSTAAEIYAAVHEIPFEFLSHVHKFEKTMIQEPTCVSTGLLHKICFCKVDFPDEVLPALGHEEAAEDEQLIAASCWQEGIAVRSCSRCHQVLAKITQPKTEHSYGEWEYQRADEKEGWIYEIRTCQICKKAAESREAAPIIPLADLDGMELEVGERICVRTKDSEGSVVLSAASGSIALQQFTPRYTLLTGVRQDTQVTVTGKGSSESAAYRIAVVNPTTEVILSAASALVWTGETLKVPFIRNAGANGSMLALTDNTHVVNAEIKGEAVELTGISEGTAEIYICPLNPLNEKAVAKLTVTVKNGDQVGGLTLRSRKKGVLEVYWDSSGSASGYQILYSKNAKFKSAKKVTIKGNTKNSRKIQSLKSKKNYYVKIRPYFEKNGKKDYGTWSFVKKIKIK